jgi:protein involved in polysaccharide export with SLBB domain
MYAEFENVIEIDRIAVYAGNNESLWQLSQNHIVLNVIHVAGGFRVHLRRERRLTRDSRQVGTNDGKTTFGFVLSRQIPTQPRESDN